MVAVFARFNGVISAGCWDFASLTTSSAIYPNLVAVSDAVVAGRLVYRTLKFAGASTVGTFLSAVFDAIRTRGNKADLEHLIVLFVFFTRVRVLSLHALGLYAGETFLTLRRAAFDRGFLCGSFFCD
jgi:hypothetical protein